MDDFDIEPPSFSLGLDLDPGLEPRAPPRPDPASQPARRYSTAPNLRIIEEEDDDFESPVKVPDHQISNPPRALKRLRRGPTLEARKEGLQDAGCNVDDDIEDFSSEEDFPGGSLRTHSVCSSSKPSLHGQRVLSSQNSSQLNTRKRKEISNASTSVNGEPSGSNVLFPKLTTSPLRRFQLIDSDSDDPSTSEGIIEEAAKINFPLKEKLPNSSKYESFRNLGTESTPIGKHKTEDLWKDFSSEKSFSIPTPAFDEVCQEYFSSMKKKNVVEIPCNGASNGTEWSPTSVPPSHCYFFHKDARIQKLVRERLPYFFPLGTGNNQGHKQQGSSVIDYMGQFENNSRQGDRGCNVEKSSTRGKKNVKQQDDSENWVNPKGSAGLPKDAGKRRVQAVGKSAGHWYTGSDGRRVYVNKSGQELTGQIAYRHYEKESGVGFKNSKKKTTAKKKGAAKRKPASKKK